MTAHDLEGHGLIGAVPYRDGRGTRFFSNLSWIVLFLAVPIWAVTLGAIQRDDLEVHAIATLAMGVAGTILTLILFKSFYWRHMAMLLLIQVKALTNRRPNS